MPGNGLIASRWAAGVFALAVVGWPRAVLGDIDPASGIDFVTIGAPGNAPWPGDGTLGDKAIGRGSVPYEYRIGRFEVTSAEWVDFFNAAFDRPQSDWIPHLQPPDFWGGIPTTANTPGGLRWTTTSQTAMLPTGDIDWRTAAIYTNWLHNGKSDDRSAFLNGAYDVSTFGYFGNIFTDQFTHNPDARYWIPTWDEWLKAAHFDPNKDGPGLGGWWKYSHRSDSPTSGGPPGIGEANWGIEDGSQFSIPLGAYPTVMSPWGLLDIAGATTEWTEQVQRVSGGVLLRYFDGTGRADSSAIGDSIGAPSGSDFPSFALNDQGFRIAASIPVPASCLPVAGYLLWHVRRRRSEVHIEEDCDKTVRNSCSLWRGGARVGATDSCGCT